jgi:hypothetical protein
VLDPLFAKGGHTSYAEGHQILFHTFRLDRKEVQALRDEALALVKDCAFSENLKVALRALKTFEDALCGPLPFFNREISQEERAQWVPEQLTILGILKELVRQTTRSLIHLRIMEVLHWHSRYSSPDVKRQAQEIIAAIPDSFELRLTRMLTQSRDAHELLEVGEDVTSALQRSHPQQVDRCRSVASEYWQRYATTSECIKDLNERLLAFQACGRESHPAHFLDALLDLQPNRAGEFCEAALNAPDSPLAMFFGLFLAHVRRAGVPTAIALGRRALESGHAILCRSLADVYDRPITWSGEIQSDDLAILQGLLNQTDDVVKRMGINALRCLGRLHPETAVSLARLVEIGTNAALGEELCALFDAQFGIPPATLSDDDFSILLMKLEPIDRLDHHVNEFLAFATAHHPHKVFDLLLRRVERGDASYEQGFQPIPYLGLHYKLSALANSSEYEAVLRQARARALLSQSQSRFWLTKLFDVISLGYTPACLGVLREWIDSSDPGKIEAAAALLQEAPAGFVFDQQDFVANVLDKAYRAGAECYRLVSNHLYYCATAHGRERTGGGPFPQDIALRDRATAAVARTQPGSPERRFFESLVRRAKQNIQDQQARDEEIES